MEGIMKVFTESIISEMKTTNENKRPGVLCTLVGPCMEFGSVNRNNRIYSRKLVEDRILKNPTVQECIKNHSMLGEGGHPEDRIDISYPQVGISCNKLWIPEGNSSLLYGEFDVLDTPTGRILNTLAQYGTKLGISARAVADSVQKDGHEVILENSYELITFDAVTEPGFKCARLEKAEPLSKPVNKMSTNELKENRPKGIILNATVLYKTPKLLDKCDLIVYVQANWIKRFNRARKRDHMNEMHILQRFSAQKNLFEKYKQTGKQIIVVKN